MGVRRRATEPDRMYDAVPCQAGHVGSDQPKAEPWTCTLKPSETWQPDGRRGLASRLEQHASPSPRRYRNGDHSALARKLLERFAREGRASRLCRHERTAA